MPASAQTPCLDLANREKFLEPSFSFRVRILIKLPIIVITDVQFIFQVNHRKLCFKPPSSELGLVPRILQFFFDVQDTSGNILTNQRFTILLKPVDNKPPVITNGGINILEDGITIISTDNLDVVDPDTDSKDLVFEVSSDWFSCKGKATFWK